MIVRQSTLDAMERRAITAERNSNLYQLEYFKLKNQWNELVSIVNAKGGVDFLRNGALKEPQPQFSAEELNKLIMLCHPDKHNGKSMATELTQKLLDLKRTL